MFETPSINKLKEALASSSNPIGMRMRATYFLKQTYEIAVRDDKKFTAGDEVQLVVVEEEKKDNTEEETSIDIMVIDTLTKSLMDTSHGSLLRHEFAYVMGQLRDQRCCDCIERILLDESDCVMVRHECGEALGAIGAARSLPVLKQAMERNVEIPEIGQTCKLAMDYMEWKLDGGQIESDIENMPMVCACMLNPYSSIDPAPPHPKHANMSTSDIGLILRDTSIPLFLRYRAMFSLRNRGGTDCVLELGKALLEDTSSALFRHEIAYVLGQMQHGASVEALSESLDRKSEHAMVRHECAEALGAIEDRWDDVQKILTKHLNDDDVVIRDSCVVALDAADYWGHGKKDIIITDEVDAKV